MKSYLLEGVELVLVGAQQHLHRHLLHPVAQRFIHLRPGELTTTLSMGVTAGKLSNREKVQLNGMRWRRTTDWLPMAHVKAYSTCLRLSYSLCSAGNECRCAGAVKGRGKGAPSKRHPSDGSTMWIGQQV